jgi:hydroxyacylglutathione hydrolase
MPRPYPKIRSRAVILEAEKMPGELIHEVIPVGLLQCNCSILGDPETHEAVVIDPGDEVDRILDILEKHELKVRSIISTHTHVDHVGGLARLHRATRAPVLIHQSDLDLYRHLDMQAQWIGIPTPETLRIQDFVKEGDRIGWGHFAARVLHTPGHTPGSICLVVDSASPAEDRSAHEPATSHARARGPAASTSRLIAGDTLFRGSIGRTDLWGGSYPEIINSIREKLIVLPENVVVYPGHGDITTIGAEREHNPFLR